MKSFKAGERRRQMSLMSSSDLFDGDKGYGRFGHGNWPFVLECGAKNIYAPVRDAVMEYFRANGIAWWKGTEPSGHILSSQIACLNHLFAVRNDRKAVLDILNGIRNEFVDVEQIPCDVAPQGYISFEVVSKFDNLNENQNTRGSNCTSVDAVIYAKHRDGSRWIIPIEWKYTESYPDVDKSKEGVSRSEEGALADNGVCKGVVRMNRYNKLITESEQLRTLDDYGGSIYYQEPFYQLMRQTLWAEQIIRHKDREQFDANEFMHVHVIPSRNHNLLHRTYKVSGRNMEDSWRAMLSDQSRYVIVDPEVLMTPVKDKYPHLWAYLKLRYWPDEL